MFKRMLVAIDGSATSNAGLKYGAALAADQHATLLALHVVDDSVMTVNFDASYFPSNYLDTLYETLHENGRKILAKAEALAGGLGVEIKPVLVESGGQTVAQTILRQARKLKADLIVLGTHGRRGMQRMLVGSDAEAVLREARVPVLLVRRVQPTKRGRRAPVEGVAPAIGPASKPATRRPAAVPIQ